MRIDVKTVKGKEYLQFVDNHGSLLHIGSASDFDSWLISAIIWEQQWMKECYEKREDFFDLFESKMKKRVSLDSNKIESFSSVRSQTAYPSRNADKQLHVPKTYLFGHLEKNENVKQQRWRQLKWCLNEWGIQVQKRLDEISSKQRQLSRKNEAAHSLTEKERKLKILREMQNNKRKITSESIPMVLSIIRETEAKKGTAHIEEVIATNAVKNKMPKEETERIVRQLLREGTIYEPREGHLKKT
jgi:vacuolar-type H+-ATPase subunit I/STV1